MKSKDIPLHTYFLVEAKAVPLHSMKALGGEEV
jgi:hypothetical protein